jgi:hypothetical protein
VSRRRAWRRAEGEAPGDVGDDLPGVARVKGCCGGVRDGWGGLISALV